jgi:hypothetical protein
MARGHAKKGHVESYLFSGTGTLVAKRFVKLASDTTISPCSGTSDLVIGVLDEATAKTDVPVGVTISGVAETECGAAVTRGTMVEIVANGRVQDYSSGLIVGMALRSGTAGQIVPVLVGRVA